MPKFLDEPSWYNSRGILLYGVGVDTDERPGVGDVPCVHLPSGEINWRHLMVNGATSGDISIYAPSSATGISGGFNLPYIDVTNLTWKWLGTGAQGYVLTSSGLNEAPVWSSTPAYYRHDVCMATTNIAGGDFVLNISIINRTPTPLSSYIALVAFIPSSTSPTAPENLIAVSGAVYGTSMNPLFGAYREGTGTSTELWLLGASTIPAMEFNRFSYSYSDLNNHVDYFNDTVYSVSTGYIVDSTLS